MYGDMMYCNNCGEVFMDEWRGHDTRTNNRLISNCPFCDSCSCLNASQFIERYEKRVRQNMYSATAFYKHIKGLYMKYCLTWKAKLPADIFLTKKEKENFRKHFLVGIAFNAGITFDEAQRALSMFSSQKI